MALHVTGGFQWRAKAASSASSSAAAVPIGTAAAKGRSYEAAPRNGDADDEEEDAERKEKEEKVERKEKGKEKGKGKEKEKEKERWKGTSSAKGKEKGKEKEKQRRREEKQRRREEKAEEKAWKAERKLERKAGKAAAAGGGAGGAGGGGGAGRATGARRAITLARSVRASTQRKWQPLSDARRTAILAAMRAVLPYATHCKTRRRRRSADWTMGPGRTGVDARAAQDGARAHPDGGAQAAGARPPRTGAATVWGRSGRTLPRERIPKDLQERTTGAGWGLRRTEAALADLQVPPAPAARTADPAKLAAVNVRIVVDRAQVHAPVPCFCARVPCFCARVCA